MKAWAYKDFKIDELFTVTSSKKKFNANDVTFGGRYPYVVRTSDNNGIRGFIDEDVKYLNDGKTISFGQDTATIFYQESPYFTGDKIKVLSPKFNIDNRIAVYMLSCMRKSFSNFQWGVSSFNETILKSIEIRIPITSSGEIDFAFMQARIQEMEQARIQEMEQARIQEMDTYLKVAGFEDCKLNNEEKRAIKDAKNSQIHYMPYRIKSLMKGETGDVDIQNKDINGKGCYFINSGVTEQGIKGKTDRVAKTFAANTITIDFFGNAYYRSFEYKLATHNHVFSYSGDCIKNEAVGLYLVAQLGYLSKIYSFSNMGTKPIYDEHYIDLPVDSDGEIDYHFMEIYIRAQEKLAIQRVKDWREKEIAATKEVVDADTVRPASKKKRNARFIYIPSSEISPSQRYTTHLPVYPLRAACGYFDECGSLPEEEAEGWLDVSGQLRHLNKDMYIVHAEGRSMEPKIHDGDLCVFEKTAGSRQGKIVLAKAKDELDPDASSYTIKKYSSEKCAGEGGRNIHTRIVLSPLNSEFQPIVLEADTAEEGEFQIYGELIHVIPHDI